MKVTTDNRNGIVALTVVIVGAFTIVMQLDASLDASKERRAAFVDKCDAVNGRVLYGGRRMYCIQGHVLDSGDE